MESLLIISDEPALAETLASELVECTLTQARPKEAAAHLREGKFRLILADEGCAPDALTSGKVPVIKLTRPVRLSDLLYTIRTRLQSKSAGFREEIPLSAAWKLAPAERLLVSTTTNERIALTEKEVQLLLCLLENKSAPTPRDTLLKRVWGYSDDIATHTIETHIYRLRGKLRAAGDDIDIIFDEGGGYRLKTSS